MKKQLFLSLLAFSALSINSAYAENSIKTEQGVVYLGAGYTASNVLEEDATGNKLNEMDHYNVGTFIAGFTDKSKYWGAEFRFSGSLGNGQINGEDFESTFINMGLFLKPQYKFENNVKLYGLAGYSAVYVNYRNQDNYEGNRDEAHVWQYGAGISYSLNDRVDIFADYTCMLNSEDFNDNHPDYNYKIGGITFGATYSF